VKGDKILAVLDFEAACRGKFVYDLATAVNAFCFDGENYQLKRFEALIAGYESLRALSLAEWDAFPNELRFSALRSPSRAPRISS
jgi:homoserine kinase type II